MVRSGASVLLFLISSALHAQFCWQDSSGLIPLNDLGTGSFGGFRGGLYPFGQNDRPPKHALSGIRIGEGVKPLDVDATVDYEKGKTVFLAIGMSNSREEFEMFRSYVLESNTKSFYLRLVNGAQGGKDINDLLDPATDYWNVVEDSLTLSGFTPDQVQVIWFKEAELGPTGMFPDYAFELRDKFKLVMNLMMNLYPNLKLCYLTSRIYGDYGDPPLNPEPYAYYNGWSVKFLIEDQIKGDPSLRYSGPDRVSPWLSWSAYVWADGKNPRSDGLTWICPDDFKPDGSHPSIQGREKVADRLMAFFSTDETALPWFRGRRGLEIETAEGLGISAPSEPELYQNYPNPFNPITTIRYRLPFDSHVVLTVSDIVGREVARLADGWEEAGYKTVTFDAGGHASGVYFCRLCAGSIVRTARLLLLR